MTQHTHIHTKYLLALLISLGLYINHSHAQQYAVDKGAVILSFAGDINIYTGDLYKFSDANRVRLATSGAYFVHENIFTGLQIDYDSERNYNNGSWAIGPKVGYAFGHADSKIFPFVGASASYIFSASNNMKGGYSASLGLGSFIALRPHLSLTTEIGFNINKMKYELFMNGVYPFTSTYTTKGLYVSIGISAMLFKSQK